MANYPSTHTGKQIDDAVDAVISKESTWDAKQDRLIAGTNITIAADGKTISATGGSGSSTWGSITGTLDDQTDLKSALDAKQNKLTAINGLFCESNGEIGVKIGQGLTLDVDGKLAAVPAGTVWGGIGGDITDQTDLQDAFADKQDTLVAGTGISIAADGKTISATNTVPAWVNNVISSAVQGKLTTNLPDILQYHVTTVSAVDANGAISGTSNLAKRLTSTVVTTGDDDLITKSGFNSWVSKLGGVQKKLTAGTNITIAADGTISASGGSGSVAWGSITGTLSSQTDLNTALAAKADSSAIPTKVSDLNNDSGFITSAALSGYQTTIPDVASGATTGKFVSAVSQTNGKISVTYTGMDNLSNSNQALTDDDYTIRGTNTGYLQKSRFSMVWSYIYSKISSILGIDASNMPVTGGVSQIKIVKVASIPASPDANTIYLVSE